MEFLADTWVLWTVLTAVSLGGMIFYRQNHKSISTFTSSEDFSVRSVFLSFRKGEGDIFIGFMVAMISFSLAVAGIVRWVDSIFF